MHTKLTWGIFLRREASKLSVFLLRGHGGASCFLQAHSDCSNTLKQWLRGAGEQPDAAGIAASRSEVCHYRLLFEPLPSVDFLRPSISLNMCNKSNIYLLQLSHACMFTVSMCTFKHKCISSHQHAQITSALHKPKGDVLPSGCQIIISFFSFSVLFVTAWRVDFSKVMSSRDSHTCRGFEKAEWTWHPHTCTHVLETPDLTASSREADLLLSMSFLRLEQASSLT